MAARGDLGADGGAAVVVVRVAWSDVIRAEVASLLLPPMAPATPWCFRSLQEEKAREI